VEAATTAQATSPVEGVSSFAESLFLGELHEDVVFPYPRPDAAERERVRALVASMRELAADIDPRAMEDARWVPDELLAELGVPDYSVESAVCKVAATEFTWYQANRALQLAGGEGYMRDQPYEKILRDQRIFPIFEGANDVMREFIALSGIQPLGNELRELGDLGFSDPIHSIGVLARYVGSRVERELRPQKITKAHDELASLADDVSDHVKQLRSVSEGLLRKHRKGIVQKQFQLKRLADAVADIYAHVATTSRVSSILEEHGVEPSGQARFIAETFCTRAASRVRAQYSFFDD
jgi:acyl-CoA dehydrogenase family member 9